MAISGATSVPKWHEDAGAVLRFVADLVAGEMIRLRPTGGALPPRPWPADLFIDESGLGLDSLERLTVASALTEALHLDRDGDALLARRRLGEWADIVREHLRSHDADITFLTSGSSGPPKRCVQSLSELQQEIEHWNGIFGGTRRILSAVPCHHIYGFLFTLLLPARLGVGEVIDIRQVSIPSLLQRLLPGDLLVSHPAHWSLTAQHQGGFPQAVAGVTSTAPCPDALASDLHRAGLSRLVQVYGSSETGGIGWRDAPAAPYRLLPFWSRDPSSTTGLLRRSARGLEQDYPLQDRLQWQGEQQFTVLDRLDAAVQVNGINVYPSRVRQVLMEHPDVADAAVRLMSGEEGRRLKAFIVPAAAANAGTLAAALMQWVDARLPAAERPRAFTLGTCLPVSANGKACDWPLNSTFLNPETT